MTAMTYTTTRRIGRAEWTKLRTLPSTWRTAAITVAMAIGFEVAVAYSQMAQWHALTAQQRQLFDPASASMGRRHPDPYYWAAFVCLGRDDVYQSESWRQLKIGVSATARATC